MKKDTCIVCNQSVDDMFHHVFVDMENMIGPDFIDKEHHRHYSSIFRDGYEEGKPGVWKRKCFCGGTIVTIGAGESWQMECSKCSFLYDED